jgi:hypothetical protein
MERSFCYGYEAPPGDYWGSEKWRHRALEIWPRERCVCAAERGIIQNVCAQVKLLYFGMRVMNIHRRERRCYKFKLDFCSATASRWSRELWLLWGQSITMVKSFPKGEEF